MSDKKNIDRLFQEKFKDFDVSPPNNMWEKIKAQKEADNKGVAIIPLWYKIAGVAAGITLLFSLGTIFFTNPSIENQLIVSDECPENEITPTNKIIEPILNPNNTIVENEVNATTNNNQSTNPLTNNIKRNTINNNTLKEPLFNNKKNAVANNSSNINQLGNNKNTYAITEKSPNTLDKNPTVYQTESIEQKKDVIAQNSGAPNTSDKANTNVDQKGIIASPIDNTKVATTIIQNEENDTQKDSIYNSNNKKSIFDAIQEQKTVANSDTKERTSNKKWNITPNVAPVYYSSLGNGSSIDSEFSDNNKQGEINLSYGIKVAYNINKKLSVRSGVSKVDLAYNTENIGFGTNSITQGSLSNNIDINSIRNIIVSDFTSQSTLSLPTVAPNTNAETFFRSQSPGVLNHTIGYIEVPLELKYALTHTKLGIHMIGGISTLFLTDENVTIQAGRFISDNIVRDNTVNDLSFSGNIGFGIDYKLTDKFLVNLEPILKYQFNGFKGTAEDFTPYYFGVYTGISFTF